MFRINYTDLDLEQVKTIVAKGGAPKGAGCGCMAGKKIKLVLDNEGIEPPELEYEFTGADELVMTENGNSVKCGYGALTLKNTVLFTHMIPNTLRGYTVILSLDTGIAAVEEMWFIDYQGQKVDTRDHGVSIMELSKLGFFVNREVERQIYKGYFVREGEPAPEKRYEKSLRLDNKTVYWEDDLGRKRLFTYITNYFSTMVEVDTPDGEDAIALPSDYLEINDSMFFYSVGEVEYSGRLSIEVLDLFTMKKIGVTMGIDENDEFEYSLYSAKGRYLGQFATFYDFYDMGRTGSSQMASRMGTPVKGSRGTYRTSVLAKAMTDEEVAELSRKPVNLFDMSDRNTMISAERKMSDSRQCAGRKLTFRDDDGYSLDFEFITDTTLRFRRQGGEWGEQEYRATQLDEDLVFLGFHEADSVPASCIIAAFDFANGCATVLDSTFGTGHEPHDVMPVYHFGYIEMEGLVPPRTRRHGYTKELLGRSFTWTYHEGVTSQHIYTPKSVSWTIFAGGEVGRGRGGFVWAAPATYVKLRDDVYIMTWVEEKWSGCMTSVAMNLRVMHDTGFYMGAEHDGSRINFNQLSAYARDAGMFKTDGIFEL